MKMDQFRACLYVVDVVYTFQVKETGKEQVQRGLDFRGCVIGFKKNLTKVPQWIEGRTKEEVLKNLSCLYQ